MSLCTQYCYGPGGGGPDAENFALWRENAIGQRANCSAARSNAGLSGARDRRDANSLKHTTYAIVITHPLANAFKVFRQRIFKKLQIVPTVVCDRSLFLVLGQYDE